MRLPLIMPPVLAILVLPASAHDLIGAMTQESKSASKAISLALSDAVADESTRSVLNNLRLWPVPRKLTICFVSGSPDLRSRVAIAMTSNWPIASLSSARLDFDKESFTTAATCTANPKEDIRVDFRAGAGHWSYVGIESRNHVPSMNFDKLEKQPAADFDRIVTHEMGHALGLEHEHQSPAAPAKCNWNFAYIGSAYQWASDADMHANFDRLQDYLSGNRHAYVFSTYDQKSVMHYAFEAPAFLDGAKSPCFIAQNFVPSDLDRTALRVAYGPTVLAQQTATKGAIPQILQKFSTPQYGDLAQLLELKARLLDQ